VLTYLPASLYNAFIDGGAANELAAGAVMFLLLWCLAFTAEWLRGGVLPGCWVEGRCGVTL
jgi:hypothetical protein